MKNFLISSLYCIKLDKILRPGETVFRPNLSVFKAQTQIKHGLLLLENLVFLLN